MRFNWYDDDQSAVRADEPLPRYRYWKRIHPPLEPVLCAGGCGQDVRDHHLLIDNKEPYCFGCAARLGKVR